MSYTVFARKYRPQTFDDVVGQEHITRTLKNAIEQRRLAHAYIFVGPRGTGKTSTARILAKSLNCQSFDAPTTTPCGHCDACREITAGNSLDVLEFDAASNTQVDKVRELIIENVKYAPTRGRYKVYIVDEVHMLSTSSFNALLKTLEEPPEHVKFVFATTDVQKVPTTILSRCQRFDLKRIPSQLIAGHLLGIAQQEGISLSQEAADTIAHGAEGGMRDAESMLDQLVAFCGNTINESDVLTIFGLTAHQTVMELVERIISAETAGALAMLNEESEAGRDLTRLMGDLIGYLRNLLVAQSDSTSLSGEQNSETVTALVEQAGRVRQEKLLELIEQLAGAEARMRWSPNRKMHFEIAVIRAIQTLKQATLGDVLQTLGALRSGGELPAFGPPVPRAKSSLAPSATRKIEAPVQPRPKTEPSARLAKPTTAVPSPGKEKGTNTDTAEAKRTDSGRIEEEPAVMSLAAPVPEELSVADRQSLMQEETPSRLIPDPESAVHTEELKEKDAARTQGAETNAMADSVGLAERWDEVVSAVRKQRPLISGWVEAGTLVSVANDVATLAFPPTEKLAVDALQGVNNRAFLEKVMGEIAGRTVSLRATIQDGLAPKTTHSPEPETARDPMENFKDDPLIRRALEIFQAKIQPA